MDDDDDGSRATAMQPRLESDAATPHHGSLSQIVFKKLNLWLLTTAINSPDLIDRKDEANGYRGAIQMEWLKFYSIRSFYCNGVKHGEMIKQQADHVKLLGLWLEGVELHALSKAK